MRKFLTDCKDIVRGLKVMNAIDSKYLCLVIITAAISPIMSYITIYMMSLIVNELSATPNPQSITKLIVITLAANLFVFLLLKLLNHSKNYYSNQFFKSEQMYLSNTIMNMDYQDVEDTKIYHLYEKIKMESQCGYNMYYLHTFSAKCISAIATIIYSSIILTPLLLNDTTDIFIKLVLLFIILLVLVVNSLCNYKSESINSKMYEDFIPYNARFYFYEGYYDDYNTGKDIRLYALQGILEEEQKNANRISSDIEVKSHKKKMKYIMLNSVMKDVLTISIYLVVIYITMNGGMRVGDIALYVATAILFIGAVSNLSSAVQILFSNNKYLHRYFEFLSLAKDKKNSKTNSSEKINLRMENISFKYPNSDVYALQNISFDFSSYKKIAIVGENGSGKTTLIKLLCALYDGEQGVLYVNDEKMDRENGREYVDSIGTVFQDFSIFAFSVAENIAVTSDYSKEKVMNSLRKAGLGKRIDTMEHGIVTTLYKDFDDKGIEISGGEAQKIAIARAFYRDKGWYIFDEPTAALDPISESEIYDNLNRSAGDDTTVFISHRLSSCKFCDIIIVMNQGEIIQTGTHKQLLDDEDGHYYQLWTAQSTLYQ